MTDELISEIKKILQLDVDYEGDCIVARTEGAMIMQGLSNGWLSAKLFGISKISETFVEGKSSDKRPNIPENIINGMGRKIIFRSEPDYEAVLHMRGLGKPAVVFLDREYDHFTVTCCMAKSITSFAELTQLMNFIKRKMPKWVESEGRRI